MCVDGYRNFPQAGARGLPTDICTAMGIFTRCGLPNVHFVVRWINAENQMAIGRQYARYCVKERRQIRPMIEGNAACYDREGTVNRPQCGADIGTNELIINSSRSGFVEHARADINARYMIGLF